jgi:hypothetical protein
LITDLGFHRITGSINFSVSGGAFCNVIVSTELLEGVFNVEVDGNPVASYLNLEEDYEFVYFNYSSGSHKVGILGENFMPISGDMNGDHKVDITDVYILAKNFGKELQPQINK